MSEQNHNALRHCRRKLSDCEISELNLGEVAAGLRRHCAGQDLGNVLRLSNEVTSGGKRMEGQINFEGNLLEDVTMGWRRED